VSDKAAGLHGKNKVSGCGVTPGFKRFNRRQTVKAVVQFQRVKMLDVALQHL
jgi:hypothetical protein